jgi:CRISP-associated protein Cas1
VEAGAGAVWWMRWRGFELKWQPEPSIPIWKVFGGRSAPILAGRGGVSKARNAAHPANAMLNYGYAVADRRPARQDAEAFEPTIGAE